ncbi:MAG: PIG-L family deacetylase [Tannerella sp.]|jgi:LmbE family N-acetylglucosaminyl deacetylase|nr:PIG-L family deacetylase [Tannerella sp.]
MKSKLLLLLAALCLNMALSAQPLRVIVFGAHPDDCDLNVAGTAALFAQMGHKVKFVSITNGDKGHHTMQPEALAARRKTEMQKVASILGIEYDNLDNHDGELMPTIENRKKIIKLICDWKADVVITNRTNDYHPDHRNAGVLVQDAAYMISVPLMIPDGEPLLKAPVFLYMPDRFKKPAPFHADIVVDITPVVEKKIDVISAHESQVFEWLPWNGGYADKVPPATDAAARRKFSADQFLSRGSVERFREAALQWYTPEQLNNARYLEAFEICEYGKMPDKDLILKLFPMLPR